MTAVSRGKRKKRYLTTRAFLTLIALLMLLPVALTVIYSFFSQEEIKAYLAARGSVSEEKWMRILLSPDMFSIGQYWQVLIRDTAILQRFMLSVMYTVCILLGQAVIVPSLAYALSAFRFRGRDALFFLLIMLMLLPFQVTMVPNVLMLRTFNLLDTVWAVILPQWFMPFYVFLIRQYSMPAGHRGCAGAFLRGRLEHGGAADDLPEPSGRNAAPQRGVQPADRKTDGH